MDNIWTPNMRNGFIANAMNSNDERGHEGSYWFNVMPKLESPLEEDPKKAAATNALMTTIFSNPQYRLFALKMYEILINKITTNPFTRQHFMRNIIVLLKGGTSYTYLLGRADELFPYSDLDVMIYINPHLDTATFQAIKDCLNTIVLQTISQYKRSIDMMFFSNRDRLSPEQIARQQGDQFFPDELIEQFKADYNAALADMSDEDGTFLSPFENNEFRNASSKHSFVLANSNAQEGKVVRVDIPHFEMCERIPLRKTPMFCSHNRSIRFNRMSDPNAEARIGAFDLYRIRFNNLYVPKEQTDEKLKRHNVVADFIDISISDQDDAELNDFWSYGRYMMVNDFYANIYMAIPDAQTMLMDLDKMIHIYECPENKREKRQARRDVLATMLINGVI